MAGVFSGKQKKNVLVCVILSALTILVFRQIGDFDFVNYDDPVYVFQNAHISNGVSLEGIRWALTAGYAANWHPLTWISHMVDIQLFGLSPGRHHLVNLLFHTANTLLLFLIFCRTTKSIWPSAFVAALFAVHPLHVESVAWIAERKDVLSTFFWLLTMGAYVRYVEKNSISRYLAVVVFFSLGLMSKPMLVTLPFVLLLFDFWPLERFFPPKTTEQPVSQISVSRKQKSKTKQGAGFELLHREKSESGFWTRLLPLVLEKVPLFALTAVACAVTYFVQKSGGALAPSDLVPLAGRIANALVAYVVYVQKTILPFDLAVLYPYPSGRPLWQSFGAALSLCLASFLVIRNARKSPFLFVGWFWFLGTLVPVIGIVQVGNQAWADRYTYVPLIGLFVIAGWWVPQLLRGRRFAKEVLVSLSALSLLSLAIVAYLQVGYWKNSIVLFSHAYEVTENNHVALSNRGAAYTDTGNYAEAVRDLQEALRIYPYNAATHLNLGISYGRQGNYESAILSFNRAIELDPGDPKVHRFRGDALKVSGEYARAIADYQSLLKLDPTDIQAYIEIGICFNLLGQFDRAITVLDKAIELDRTGNAKAYYNRALSRLSLGSYREAISDFDMAIRINPRDSDAYSSRGGAYGKLGDAEQAIKDFDEAITMNPGNSSAYFNRGITYGKMGRRQQAFEDLKSAARLDNQSAKDLLKSQGMDW